VNVGPGLPRSMQESKQLKERQATTVVTQLALWRVKISGLAHEMGALLNVILCHAESLLERTEEETAQAALQSIIRQVEQLIPLRQQLCALDHGPEMKPRVSVSAFKALGGRPH
jgi:signal transduction histidine kinase